MSEQQKSILVLDEISADLAVYVEPKLLKGEYEALIKIDSLDIEQIKKYQELLSNVRFALNKTFKYVQYFEEFYPATAKIEKFEALNHHIHGYLEDMTILKNKIEVLLGVMKNDIGKVAVNKKETAEFFDAGVNKTKEVFDGVSKQRNPHHHAGRRFFDGDLLKAENAQGTLEIFTTGVFSNMINPDYKDEFFASLKKVKEESFQTAKVRWIKMAQNNNHQTVGYLSELIGVIKPALYQFLNIKPVKELIKE